jgi:O-antigen/teichoic acid export membrane protein
LVLLAVLASSLPTTGINVSWMVPALIAVLIVTVFLARPSVLAGRKQALGTLPSRRMLGETVVGEYVTGLASTAVPLLLPILVVSRLGVEANAYFALPWLISTSLSLMLWNIASSLLVHASESGQSDQFSFLIRRALKLAVLIGAAGAAAVWVLGPMLMSLLGSAYAENSTWLLRLVALAAPSSAVIVVWTTAARVRHRLKQVIALQVCIGVSVLGLSTVLVGEMGIVGIGVAYLATQTVAALVLLRPLWAIVRRDPAANFAAPAAPAETVPDHAAPDQSALTLDGAPR